MKVPTRLHAPFTLLFLASLMGPGLAEIIHSADFNEDDGGYRSETHNPLAGAAIGEWFHFSGGGTNDSGAWSADGGEGGPFEQWLTSPVITIPTTGPVTLEFDHLYDFELTWDGGVVMTRLNNPPAGNDPFVQVSTFLENGYDDFMQSGDDWGYPDSMNGLEMFGGSSGGFVHSIADLGELQAGDTLEIRFRGGWDWATIEGPPGWIIDNVVVKGATATPARPVKLDIISLAGDTLQLTVGNLPEGQAFHLRQSADGETFGPTTPPVTITDTTPQPISIMVDPPTNAALLYQVYEGAAPPP